MKRVAILAPLCCLPLVAVAQTDLIGPKRFPQFRSFSGLPGGGFGVARDGTVSFNGAFALSSPIAYSVKGWSAGLGNLSSTLTIRFPERGGESKNRSNGTAWLMSGTDLGFGTLTGGSMVLSSKLDTVQNFQFTPRIGQQKFDLAFGVQDAFNEGGEAGEAIDKATGGGNSRSFYGVVTVDAGSDTFLSLGTGTRRFEGVFGNASFPIMRRVRGMVEYDAFNWNVGLLGEVARIQTKGGYEPKYTSACAFLGIVRGKYMTWGISIGF